MFALCSSFKNNNFTSGSNFFRGRISICCGKSSFLLYPSFLKQLLPYRWLGGISWIVISFVSEVRSSVHAIGTDFPKVPSYYWSLLSIVYTWMSFKQDQSNRCFICLASNLLILKWSLDNKSHLILNKPTLFNHEPGAY